MTLGFHPHLFVTREGWGAEKPKKRPLGLGPVSRIVVHRSETPDHDPFSAALRAQTVQRHHMIDNGWDDIGYHLLIGQMGEILCGRPLWARGAHVNHLNRGSIGLCLMCNRDPTMVQLYVLQSVLEWGIGLFGLERDDVLGHGEVRSTDCPGGVVLRVLRRWRSGDPRPTDNGREEPIDDEPPTAA